MTRESPPRFLLEGRPGVGKTTVLRRLVGSLRSTAVPLAGFTTEEIRERCGRVGFAVESLSGERGTLAHVDLPGPPRVGKYGVDLAALERIALPALRGTSARVVVLDELGKMELASSAFRDVVTELFARDASIVATIQAARHPFGDALKRRRDVEVLRITERNRDDLPGRLAERLVRRSPRTRNGSGK
jgi:nucleoside-triphosphatase